MKIDEKLLSENARKFTQESLQGCYDFLCSSGELQNEQRFYDIINSFPELELKNLLDTFHFYNYFNHDKVVNPEAFPLKALLMLFVIEGATLGFKWQSSFDWLKDPSRLFNLCNKNSSEIKRLLPSLEADYLKEFGAGRNFKGLFLKHLKPNEKIDLLQSFKIYTDNEGLQSFCYDQAQKRCRHGNCCLDNDVNPVESHLDDIAGFLVDIRNQFAHKSKLSHFTAQVVFSGFGQVSPELISFHKYSGSKGKEVLLRIQLSYDVFDALSKKIIFRFLDNCVSKQ